MDTFPLRVQEAGEEDRFEARDEPFEETRYAREDVDVPVHDGDGDPEVVRGEEVLVFEVARFVGREHDHAEFRGEGGGGCLPVEFCLGLAWSCEAFHPFEGFFVEF